MTEPREMPRLLMIDDLAGLRRKLTAATGDLAIYWRNYLDLAGSEPLGEFQALPPLAWLVTGEPRYAEETGAVFRELLRVLPLADAAVEAQFHPYTVGAPLARFAVFLDWIWDSSILTGAERRALAGEIVSQVYSHCFLRLKGRLPAGDNQQASMAFACAVTGYVFGVKRGASPAARRMYAEGCARYESLLASLGAGGWCGEGSTYHHQVMCPILALFTAFMEQVTGRASFDRRVGAATVQEALELAVNTINGAGMLPGWDQYGNCAPELKTGLVYLARKTGRVAPLEAIGRHGMWSENEILAWYNDDKVWSLVLWPELPAATPADSLPAAWLVPPVGGKLAAADGSIDLMQIWDRVEAGRPGRAHLNPNSLELCSWGALHTADGHGPAADPAFFTCRDGLSFAAAHSVVLVDDEGYRYPDHPWHGHGEWLAAAPGLQALRGDVSDLYRELWQVDEMKRTSLLLGDRLILVHDRFASAQAHRFTWQLMLRPTVSADGRRARQRLREGVVLDIATTAERQFSVNTIRDYPRGMEQQTHRLAMTTGEVTEGTFPVVLRPHRGTAVVRDLSARWTAVPGDETPPAGLFDAPATACLRHDHIGHPVPRRTMWFGQRCHLLAEEAGQAERLTIQRGQVDRLEVFVNGRQAPELFEHPSIKPGIADVQKPDGRFWPSHFDVRGLLREGANEIAIASSEFRGQTICGPVLLMRLVKPEASPLSIAREGDALAIEDGDRRWLVLPDNPGRIRRAFGAGGETDAEVAVRQGETIALAFVTAYRDPGLAVASSARVHLVLTADELWVDALGHPEAEISLSRSGQSLTVRCAEGDAPRQGFRKVTITDSTRPPAPPPDTATVPPLPTPDGIAAEVVCGYDAGLLAGSAGNRQTALTAALSAADWRTRIGACEVLTAADRAWAQPLLLALLEAENREELYPPLKENWPFAKMKTTFGGWARPELPEAAKRRYRLKTAVFEALGRIGDTAAEAAIRLQLETSTDFYPVAVQACLAAGRLRLEAAVPALEALTTTFERNTREAAVHTLALLRRQIDWQAYRQLVYAPAAP